METKYVPHEVIENKLLTALENDRVAAMLLTKNELAWLISIVSGWPRLTEDQRSWLNGANALYAAAFESE